MGLYDLIAVLGTQLFVFIVWGVRLEMRVRYLERFHSECLAERKAHEILNDSRLLGLSTAIAEIKNDIKHILVVMNKPTSPTAEGGVT